MSKGWELDTLTPSSVLLFWFLKHLWMGGLTHCFIRLKCGLTQCLIDLFSFVWRGVFISIVDYGGNFLGENGGLAGVLFCFNDKIQRTSFGCEVDFC